MKSYKIHTGPRGGKYYIKNGRKVYLRKKASKTCTKGNKKFRKVVNGRCVRFGDPNMTIKKNNPKRRRAFCARHRCKDKRDPATPGYQSCKKWNCQTGR